MCACKYICVLCHVIASLGISCSLPHKPFAFFDAFFIDLKAHFCLLLDYFPTPLLFPFIFSLPVSSSVTYQLICPKTKSSLGALSERKAGASLRVFRKTFLMCILHTFLEQGTLFPHCWIVICRIISDVACTVLQ